MQTRLLIASALILGVGIIAGFLTLRTNTQADVIALETGSGGPLMPDEDLGIDSPSPESSPAESPTPTASSIESPTDQPSASASPSGGSGTSSTGTGSTGNGTTGTSGGSSGSTGTGGQSTGTISRPRVITTIDPITGKQTTKIVPGEVITGDTTPFTSSVIATNLEELQALALNRSNADIVLQSLEPYITSGQLSVQAAQRFVEAALAVPAPPDCAANPGFGCRLQLLYWGLKFSNKLY